MVVQPVTNSVQLTEPSSTASWDWEYNLSAGFNNVNTATLHERQRATNRENEIVASRSGQPVTFDTPNTNTGKYAFQSSFVYRNINDALKHETSNRIEADNLMKEKHITKVERSVAAQLVNGAANENIVLTETTLQNWNNFNDAFAFENHRSVRREGIISDSATVNGSMDKLFDSTTDYRTEVDVPLLDGSGNTGNQLFKAVTYNEVQTLDIENHNEAVLKEHRRAVKVENEINTRIEGILNGVESSQLDSLSEIIQLFTSGDLKLTNNLQEFSKRYNALVSDFNTLSESHKDLIERFNTTFESVNGQAADLAYSQATRAAIQFNVNTGNVNASIVLTDNSTASDWDRRDVAETGGVYVVRSSTVEKELCLPLTSIFAGATLIVRRVDGQNGQNKSIKVKWAESTEAGYESADYFILAEDKAEVVLLGTGAGWVPLKPNNATRVDGNSSTWVVGTGGIISNPAIINLN